MDSAPVGADGLPEDHSIELTFTPQPGDYARASRWTTRRCMGRLLLLWKIVMIILILTAGYGLMLMIDNLQGPEGDRGFWIMIIPVYLVCFGLFYMRRTTMRRIYGQNDIFASQRTIKLDHEGFHSTCPQQTYHVPWSAIDGVEMDAHLIYIPVGRAYTLFIPRRIASSESDILRVVTFIQKQLGKSAGNS